MESREQIIYDDSKIKESIKSLESIKKYDDSELRDKIKSVDEKIHPEFDDKSILISINKLLETTLSQSKEIAELKKAMASSQKEIRSNRKESGLKIDIVEQKLNRITEVK